MIPIFLPGDFFFFLLQIRLLRVKLLVVSLIFYAALIKKSNDKPLRLNMILLKGYYE